MIQALTVHQALRLSPADTQLHPTELKIQDFLDVLIEQMQKVEDESPRPTISNRSGDRIRLSKVNSDSHTPYTDALKQMKQVLADRAQGSELSPEEVVLMFGNNVSAPKSVPTAIYCALRAHQPVAHFDTDDVFLRTLFNALSLGGDTDTIASMACSIVGAMYGEQIINEMLSKNCELHEEVVTLADRMFDKCCN